MLFNNVCCVRYSCSVTTLVSKSSARIGELRGEQRYSVSKEQYERYTSAYLRMQGFNWMLNTHNPLIEPCSGFKGWSVRMLSFEKTLLES